MSILIDKSTRVIVQGITGSQGKFHTGLMQQYGTVITAGVTPGKGGSDVLGIPVCDTVREAVDHYGANASVIFPAAYFWISAASRTSTLLSSFTSAE